MQNYFKKKVDVEIKEKKKNKSNNLLKMISSDQRAEEVVGRQRSGSGGGSYLCSGSHVASLLEFTEKNTQAPGEEGEESHGCSTSGLS